VEEVLIEGEDGAVLHSHHLHTAIGSTAPVAAATAAVVAAAPAAEERHVILVACADEDHVDLP